MATVTSDQNGRLDPSTKNTLQAFDQRRTRLLILQTLAIGFVVMIAAMLLVAIVDYLWLLSDSVRWALSAIAYATVAAVVWWFGVRRISNNDQRLAARRIESAEPRFGDDLLSAVELSDPNDANGSLSFRARLQERVAKRISQIEIDNLLPLALIRRWLSTGAIVLAICAACFFIPNLQFGRRIARAMLPGMPIQRASLTQVEIVQPSPASRYVAEGDAVGIVVDISGKPANQVRLDFQSADGNSGRTEMTPRVSVDETGVGESGSKLVGSSTQRFAANLPVGSVPVQYRVVAGDAITLWHKLTPLPRPRVVSFDKRYIFPEYAKLGERNEVEDHGDLNVLSGTVAEVTITFDQPVEQANMQYGFRGAQIPLKQVDEAGTQFLAEITVRTPGQYQVDATSVKSGLNNPFGPTYSITPVLDAPPIARWADSHSKIEIVSPLEVLPMAGTATDDLPVDEVYQEFQLNEEPFRRFAVDAAPPTRESDLQWSWDLLERNGDGKPTPKLGPGDILRTRLVAIDRRGNRGESELIEYLIADEGFQSDRHDQLDELSQLAAAILEWTSQSINQSAVLSKAASDELKPNDLDRVLESTAKLSEETAEVVEKLSANLELAPNVHRASLLELIGRVMLDIQRKYDASIQTMNRIRTNELGIKESKLLLTRVRQTSKSNENQSERIENLVRSLVGQQLTIAISQDAQSLHKSLQRLTSDESNIPVARYSRYLSVTKGRLESIWELAEQYGHAIPNSTLSHLRGEPWRRWAERWLIQFDQAIENPPGDANYRTLVRRFSNELFSKSRSGMFDDRMGPQLTNTPRDMRRELQSIGDQVDGILDAAMLQKRYADKAANTKDSAERRELNRLIKFYSGHYQQKLQAVLTKISQEQQLHRRRPSVDLQYASDLGLLGRALQNVNKDGFVPYRDEPADQVHRNIAWAIRALESGHEISSLHKEIRSLHQREQRLSNLSRATYEHRFWLERLTNTLEYPVSLLRNIRVENDVVQPIDQVRYGQDTQHAKQLISSRQWKADAPTSAASDLAKVDSSMQSARGGLTPAMIKARDMLHKYVLTLSEQAREAAKEAKEAEERIDQREQNPPAEQQNPDAPLAEEKRETQEAEEAAKETIEMLMDRANTADILDQEERELARDADIAASQIQEAMQEAKNQMDQATNADSPEKRSEALEKTEEALEELAEALEKTAEHFEAADKGEDVSQSREELRQAESELQNANELEQRFQDAEAAAETAQTSPEELMRQLEEELQRNELMQQELSEISEQAAQDAQRNLERAEIEDRELNRQLERSDADLQEQKRRMAKQMEQLVRRADTAKQELVQNAEQALNNAKNQEGQKRAREAREQLQQAINQSRQVNDNSLLSEMKNAAAELAEAVEEATEALEQVKEQAEKSADNEIHQNEQQRKQTQNQFENAARLARNRRLQALNSEKQAWDIAKRDAANREKNADREADNTKKQIDNAKEQLKKNPDNEGLKKQIQQLEEREQRQRAQEQSAKESKEFAQEQRKNADQRSREIQKQKTPKLNSKNPAAQFAQDAAEKAQEELGQIGQQLKDLADKMEFQQELAIPKQEAQQLAQRQQNISEDVDDAAQQLERAARHEDRLNKPQLAEQLAEAAQSVQENAAQESQEAEQALEESAESGEKSAEASQQVSEATEQIGQEADKLAEMLSQMQQAAQAEQQQAAAQQQSQQTARPSEQDMQNAQQMAQTLDELDRAMAQQAQAQAQQQAQAQAQAQSQQPGQEPGQQQQASSGQPQSQNQPGQQPSQQPGQQPSNQTAAQASPSVQQMVDAQNQQAARQRMEQMQQAQQQPGQPGQPNESQQASSQDGGMESSGERNGIPKGGPLTAQFQFTEENGQWGQLRERRTDDATESRGSQVAPQYRREVEAYFKAIAKQAAEASK